jgi:hypothetical protein
VIRVSVTGTSVLPVRETGVGRRQGVGRRDGESHGGWHFLAAGSKGNAVITGIKERTVLSHLL